MKNKVYKSGYQRSDDGSKVRYSLIPTELLTRLAIHYTNGAKMYGDRNWMKANSPEEMERFKDSAWRHFIAWQEGQTDEEHGIACVWNIFAYEYLKNPPPK